MDYIDDYTINSEPASISADGQNDFDKRIDKNEHNPKYSGINESGRKLFNGKTTYQMQRETGHLIEEFIAKKINGLHNKFIPAIDLPYEIDLLVQQDYLLNR